MCEVSEGCDVCGSRPDVVFGVCTGVGNNKDASTGALIRGPLPQPLVSTSILLTSPVLNK